MNPKDVATLEKLLSVIKDHGNLATQDEVAKITIEVLKEIKGLREELEALGTDVENTTAKTDEAIHAHEGTHKRLKAAIEAVSGSVSSLSTNHDALKKLLTELKEEIDSRPGMEQFVQEAVARSLAAAPPHEPCPTDTADNIRNKLELLKGDDRLDRSAIRGLEEVATSSDVDRAISILDKRTSFLINKAAPTGGGTVTNVSSANTDIGVATGTTTPVLTLNSGIGANQIPKLDGTGQLGIGTAAPGSLLHLKNTSGSNGLTIENTTANGKAYFYVTDNTSGSNFAEFDVNSSGTAGTNILTQPNAMVLRTGAGTTNGMYLLTQNSSASMKFATGGFANSNVRMTLDSTGGLTLSSLTNGIVKSTGGLLSNATGADLPAMTSTVGGAVPTPPNNTTTFLRGDGTWSTPAAGGTSGITRSVSSISGNTTAGTTALTDYVYLSTATLTLTLPTAVGNLNQYIVKSVSGTTTLATTSAQTINGSATVTIAAGSSLTLISDNANWHVV